MVLFLFKGHNSDIFIWYFVNKTQNVKQRHIFSCMNVDAMHDISWTFIWRFNIMYLLGSCQSLEDVQ